MNIYQHLAEYKIDERLPNEASKSENDILFIVQIGADDHPNVERFTESVLFELGRFNHTLVSVVFGILDRVARKLKQYSFTLHKCASLYSLPDICKTEQMSYESSQRCKGSLCDSLQMTTYTHY